MNALKLEKTRVFAGEKTLVGPVSLEFHPGECVAILGPNGSGKSSLIRAVTGYAGEVDPSISVDGGIELDSIDPRALSPAARSKKIAYAEAEIRSEFPYPVREALALAQAMSGSSDARVAEAVKDAELGNFLESDLRKLSGGERQRVLVAMSWIQSPRLYAFDETLSQLDLNHLWRVGGAIRRRARAEGTIVLLVTHEWNFAAKWADRLLVLDRGALVAEGVPSAVLTPELLERVYPGWPAQIRVGSDARIDYPGFDD